MDPLQPVPIPEHEWYTAAMVEALRARDARSLLKLAQKYGASQLYISSRVMYLTGASLTQNQISLIITGKAHVEKLEVWERLAAALDMPDRARVILGLAPATHSAIDSFNQSVTGGLETMRRGLAEAFESFNMSEATVEDWEETTLAYGRATRHSPPSRLLQSALVDFEELHRHLNMRAPLRLQARLRAVTAQVAGLISLLATNLCEYESARRWGRIARLAARETDDPALNSWVRAQDAYAIFYEGANYAAVIDVAQHAQKLGGRSPAVGVALAAAIEARAHALMGDRAGTERAIALAGEALERLTPDLLERSAFGYNEAQLRFHEGNAFTHLGMADRAWNAQERALQLYPQEEVLDRTLIHLDRAFALAMSNEYEAAAAHATERLLQLRPDQLTDLMVVRTRQLIALIDDKIPSLSRDLRAMLLDSGHGMRAISPGEDEN